jgi:hypothetical protein
LTCVARVRVVTRMTDLPEDEQTFLRALVKSSRQKHHHVKWTDRDGTARLTVLSAPDAVRLNALAHRLGISKVELLQQAAHVPVKK